MKFLSSILWYTNVAVALLTLGAYSAPYIDPQGLWHFAFLGLAYPALAFANVAFVGWWAIARSKRAFLSAAILIANITLLQTIVNWQQPVPSTKATLKVLNYNVFGLGVLKFNDATPADFFAFVKKQSAHIACFQEYPGDPETQRKTMTAGGFRYVTSQETARPIYSKYPIVKTGHIADLCVVEEGKQLIESRYTNVGNGCSYADIDVNGTMIRVYNVQLQSNQISDTANKLRYEKGIAGMKKRSGWAAVKSMLGLYRHKVQHRAQQAQRVRAHIAECPYPVLVCGDLNDPPSSYMYQVLSQGLTDTFRERGRGLGFTYGGSVPLLRIDYILHTPDISTQAMRTPHVDFSDHYPVVATMSLPTHRMAKR